MFRSDDAILQRVQVAFEYPVVFTRGVFDVQNPVFVETVTRREPARRHRLLVVIDDAVAAAWPVVAELGAYVAHHAERLELAAAPIVVRGGEAVKHGSGEVEALWRALRSHGIDRHSYVVAIGGGAVLDMAGYAAATCHRGVRLLRLPTTVLAQNDAGVGVKNGVNAFGAKNFLGTFAPPWAVINDARFLTSLDRRDQIAGMAEAVKVALIRDPAFFAWLGDAASALASFELDAAEYMVRRCAELHLAHIAGGGDPFELGSARPLDFGHWSAHHLEVLSKHALRHGEAVAIGMALDSRYSVEAGLLDERDLATILALLQRLGLPTWHELLGARGPDGRLRVLDGLAEFREHLGGELCVTLLRGLGQGVEVHDLDEQLIARAIDWLAEERHAA